MSKYRKINTDYENRR